MMNNFELFYNYATIGDVLLIVRDLETKPTRVQIKNEHVVVLYDNDKIIGINIFGISQVMKIKANGLIVLPLKEMIDVINDILINAEVEPLNYKRESGFRIGEVLTCVEHPDSDHLHVLKVDVKSEVLDIVCGAPNVAVGQKVVVAMPNTMLFDGKRIIPSELRGQKSNGMLCSPRELHLENAPQVRGILVLDEDAIVGDDFFKIF